MEDRESKIVNRNPRSSILNPLFSVSLWTLAQRRALLCLCALLLAFLAIESWHKSMLLSDPPPQVSLRADEIQDRIDPNTADAGALAAIPNLGEKRAAQIVDYREAFVREHPNQRAFDSADDLLRMKGFGMATVANLGPYLVFPQKADARASSSGLPPK